MHLTKPQRKTPKMKSEEYAEAAKSVIDGTKKAATTFLVAAKDAVMKVAPEIWRVIKMKVIADAIAIIVFVIASVGTIVYLWLSNKITSPLWIVVSVVVGTFILGSALRRIIASDYMTLLEILTLAKRGRGDVG